MAWMQDDANTVLRIWSTSDRKYACVKTATAFGHHVLYLPHRRLSIIDAGRICNLVTKFGGGPQSSVFRGYSNFCCRRQSGRSLQLVNDVNLRVINTWIMRGAAPPIPSTSSEFAEDRRFSTKCNKIILLYIHTNVQSCSIPKSFSNSTQSQVWVFFEQCLNKILLHRVTQRFHHVIATTCLSENLRLSRT